jgi:hypothetical protein
VLATPSRHPEFRKFLNQIDRAVPAELTAHLVLHNYATHKKNEIRAWFLRHPRYHPHFTPTHISWLNQVERWFALLSQLRSNEVGTPACVNWNPPSWSIDVHNQQPKPFVRTKSDVAILSSIGRFAFPDSGCPWPNNMQEISD